jgi:hypothetical protein
LVFVFAFEEEKVFDLDFEFVFGYISLSLGDYLFTYKTYTMRRKELKQKIAQLKTERAEILYAKYDGINADLAAIAISDIDCKIVALEDVLDFERRMLPFRITLYAFIVVCICLAAFLIYSVTFKN